MIKVAVLIDNMYLQNITSGFGLERLDITKFSQHLLKNGEVLFITYVFDALPYIPQNPTQDQLDRRQRKADYFNRLRFLERVAVEEGYVKAKDVKCAQCNSIFKTPVQKAVDVKISVKIVWLALSKTVDTIVLVSGDGDLVPAVEAANNSGATVRLSYANVSGAWTSDTLIKTCMEKRELTRRDLASCTLP